MFSNSDEVQGVWALGSMGEGALGRMGGQERTRGPAFAKGSAFAHGYGVASTEMRGWGEGERGRCDCHRELPCLRSDLRDMRQ